MSVIYGRCEFCDRDKVPVVAFHSDYHAYGYHICFQCIDRLKAEATGYIHDVAERVKDDLMARFDTYPRAKEVGALPADYEWDDEEKVFTIWVGVPRSCVGEYEDELRTVAKDYIKTELPAGAAELVSPYIHVMVTLA